MRNLVENNTAFIIKEIKKIQDRNPGKKLLQKIMFLVEQKGVDLNFDFGLHFYGPYSDKLDFETLSLSNDGVIQFNYGGYSHEMQINEADFDIRPQNLNEDEKATISNLLERYKTKSASYLELLTTAIYVYDHIQEKSEDAIIAGVRKIKGIKYSTEEIQSALEEFPFFDKSV